MAKFRSRVLTVLDRLYEIVGGNVGVDQLDLVSPIQLVHDVSRESERGEGLNPDGSSIGWGAIDATPAPGAATEVDALTFDTDFLSLPYKALGDSYLEYDPYLYMVGAFAANNNVTSLNAWVHLFTSSSNDYTPIGRFTSFRPNIVPGGGYAAPALNAAVFRGALFPMYIPWGSIFKTEWITSGAVPAMATFFHFYFQPKGSTPPGRA